MMTKVATVLCIYNTRDDGKTIYLRENNDNTFLLCVFALAGFPFSIQKKILTVY